MATPGMIQDEDGAILAIRNYIENARTALRTENDRITGQIEGWRPNWQGEGATSFQAFRNTWNERFAAMLATLDQFEQSLTTTNTSFQNTDSESGSKFAGLTGSIN